MAKSRRCVCKHTWNEHDALTDGFGRTLISCMHIERLNGGHVSYQVCGCKEWRPDAEDVPVPGA